jgi:PAS domain-containing protein
LIEEGADMQNVCHALTRTMRQLSLSLVINFAYMLDNTEISENNSTTDIKPDFLDDASLLNQLPAGICVFDMAGKIVKHNVEAARLFGEKPVTRGQYEACDGQYTLHWAEHTMQHSESPVEDCIRDGKERKNIEIVIT